MSVIQDSKDMNPPAPAPSLPANASFRVEQGAIPNPSAAPKDSWDFHGLINAAVLRYLAHPYEIPAGQSDYILKALTDLLLAYRLEVTAGRVRPLRGYHPNN